MQRISFLFEAMRRPDGRVVIVVCATDGRLAMTPPVEVSVDEFYRMAFSVLGEAGRLKNGTVDSA